MRVGLVYNEKKEDPAQQSMIDDGAEHSRSKNLRTGSLPISVLPSRTQANDTFAEWDSAETIEAVHSALAQYHDVISIEADEEAYLRLREERPEIVFNMAEGLHGISREAQMPAMLEMLRIPYTGSDPLTLALCLDKGRTKEILRYYEIPTPRFYVISKIQDIARSVVDLPAIVKPLHEGSSKGIFDTSLVRTRPELEEQIIRVLEDYHEPALVEHYIGGREFTAALLGNGDAVQVLPIVEIDFSSLPADVNPIYSYEAKWIWDQSDSPLEIFRCPATLTPGLRAEIEGICRKAFHLLRCRDWCRIDLRLDSTGVPHILELNPLPGILPKPEDNSCYPKAARAAGLTYDELIQTVLATAAHRCGLIQMNNTSLRTG